MAAASLTPPVAESLPLACGRRAWAPSIWGRLRAGTAVRVVIRHEDGTITGPPTVVVSPRRGGGLLEGAGPEVAHVVNVVVLEQFRDALALFGPYGDLEQHVAVPEGLVVDREGCPVVAEHLKGPDDAGSQPVVAAILVQDACSPITAEDLYSCDIDPGRSEFPGDG